MRRRRRPIEEDPMIWLAVAAFGGLALGYVKVRRRRKEANGVGH